MPTQKNRVYAIVDIETTGGRANRDRITEVGIVRFDGHQILETYETLINPECYIPYGITEITGITQAMVADAPRFFEVAKRIVEMTEGAIFVAHNVRFDYGFLRASFKRLGYTFSRKKLCTVKLTREVFPGLPSYSLGNLINHFDIEVAQRHRALADAVATTELLRHLIGGAFDKDKAGELINLGVKSALLPIGWSIEDVHKYPEACGVYYFHDSDGDVIYVGKSINIKKRIATHFAKDTDKARKLQQFTDHITYEVTGSELLALLLESEEIKRLMPKVNRAQRRRSFPYVICQEEKNGVLSFQAQKVLAKQKKELVVLNELPSLSIAKNRLRLAIDHWSLCPKFCGLESGNGPCFDYHMGKCRGICIGEESPQTYQQRAMDAVGFLKRTFDEDFFIVEPGRTDEERALILVDAGNCKGFLYVSQEELNQPEMLREQVKPFRYQPEMLRIIQGYLAKHPRTKIIPLPGSEQ